MLLSCRSLQQVFCSWAHREFAHAAGTATVSADGNADHCLNCLLLACASWASMLAVGLEKPSG